MAGFTSESAADIISESVADLDRNQHVPDGPARVLLRVIERDPDAVRRVFG
jgi:DNA-binding transcriptional regulator YiaG